MVQHGDAGVGGWTMGYPCRPAPHLSPVPTCTTPQPCRHLNHAWPPLAYLTQPAFLPAPEAQVVSVLRPKEDESEEEGELHEPTE